MSFHPPQSLEAEKALLGALLIAPTLFQDEALEILSPEDFSLQKHQRFFRALVNLANRNQSFDAVLVAEGLKELGETEAEFIIADVASYAGSPHQVPNYSQIIWEKSRKRKLINLLEKKLGDLQIEQMSLESVQEDLEKGLTEIGSTSDARVISTLKEVISEEYRRIERQAEIKDSFLGIPSGFKVLDSITSGFQKGDLIILAGRPSMGKTSLALNIALHAGKEGFPVGIFSLEMSNQQLGQRFLSLVSGIDSQRLKIGKLFEGKDEWGKLLTSMNQISPLPVFLNETQDLSPANIRSISRKLKREKNISLLIIDYLQLMSVKGHQNREREISEISRSLKILAKELQIPILALSQLNRGIENRPEGRRRPQLSDLRESGSLEQDSDLILFVHREEFYSQTTENQGVVEVVIGKHRNGPTGSVVLSFNPETTSFKDPYSPAMVRGKEAANGD